MYIALTIISLTLGMGIQADQAKLKPASNKQEMVAHNSQPLKVATIDVLKVMRESEEGKLVTKQLELKRNDLDKKLQTEAQSFAQSRKDFESKAPMLSDTAREKEQNSLMQQGRDLEAMAQKSEDELKIAMQSASERLMNKSRKQIELFALENNLDIIWDVSGQVVYASQKTDVTKNIVQNMNKGHKTNLASNDTSKPAAKKATAKA